MKIKNKDKKKSKTTNPDASEKLIIRHAVRRDVANIISVLKRAYPQMSPYTTGNILGQVTGFPEGQFVAEYDGNIVEVRNRLEQRYLPHNHDISHRWRTRVRVEHLFDQTPWSLIASDEAFINLNNNDVNNNLQEGMNQNRSYVGVGYRFNPNFQVETGYLNQYTFNSTSIDQSNNVWMSNLNLNF